MNNGWMNKSISAMHNLSDNRETTYDPTNLTTEQVHDLDDIKGAVNYPKPERDDLDDLLDEMENQS